MSVNIALVLLCLAACKGKEHEVRSQDPAQALAVSISYAKAHEAPFQSGNAYLAYLVEDHGDIWITEISPQGQMGGGLRIIVRKQDMKVVDAGRTQ